VLCFGGILGDIRLDESGFKFGERIKRCACKGLHDKLSCTLLQNYDRRIPTIYPNTDS